MLMYEWARKWGVPEAAILDLKNFCFDQPEPGKHPEGTEDKAQSDIRVGASNMGFRLWRNNVGACKDDRGNFIRYGLCNDSKRINETFKSADLIGILPRLITTNDVGKIFGLFVSIECKKPGWKLRPNDKRTKAQMNWANLVSSMGGWATFATGPEVLNVCQ